MVVALGYSETHGENGERDVDAPEEEPLERAVFVESVEDTIARQPRGKYRGIANKLRDREKWRLVKKKYPVALMKEANGKSHEHYLEIKKRYREERRS
jgi:hypothetical protein